IWRKPVGEGAKRVTTVSDILAVGGPSVGRCAPLYHSLSLRCHANPGEFALGGLGRIWHIDPIFGSGLGWCAGRALTGAPNMAQPRNRDSNHTDGSNHMTAVDTVRE